VYTTAVANMSEPVQTVSSEEALIEEAHLALLETSPASEEEAPTDDDIDPDPDDLQRLVDERNRLAAMLAQLRVRQSGGCVKVLKESV
jgi:hypothetical protein